MKKLMRTFALMAVAALGLSACTGEKLVPDNGNADGKFVTVHFGAEAAIEGATKATLTTEDEKTFKSAWENGDVLSVEYSNDNETVDAITSGVISATWATDHFEAKLPEYRGVWLYDALYPAPNAEKKVDFGSARTQNGNAYNSKYDLMKGVAIAKNADAGKTADGQNIVFNMTRQTAIAYFHLTSTLDEEVVSAKLSVEGKDAYLSTSDVQIGKDSQGNTSYAQGYAFTKTEGVASKEINLTFDAGTAPKTSGFKLWFNVLPTPYDKMTLTVETANHTLTISRNAKAADKYEAGKLYKVVKDIPADKWVKKGGETPSTKDFTLVTSALSDWTGSYLLVGEYSTDETAPKSYYAFDESIYVDKTWGKCSEVVVDNNTIASTYGTMALEIVPGTTENTYSIMTPSGKYFSASAKGAFNLLETYSANDCDFTITFDKNNAIVIKQASSKNERQIRYNYNNGKGGLRWYEGTTVLPVYLYKGPSVAKYSVSFVTVEGGSFSASPSKAEAGAEITLTATPAEGYAFNNDWSVKGVDETVIEVVDGKFTMPAQNVTVSGTFSKVAYTITKAAAENGSFIVKNGDAEVTTAFKGDKLTLEATPAEGFTFGKWTVTYIDGETKKSVNVNANTFYMPSANVTVSATFVEAAAVPVYASVADLIAAGKPTEAGTKVTVTLTDDEIIRFHTLKDGTVAGAIIKVGTQEVEIFCKGTPSDWKVGGTISGTLTNCDWKLYNSTWELCPADYSELTYKAPLPTCATPVITIDESGVVSIACETAGATIHYTAGDSPADPTEADAVFSAVTLTDGQTIKAIAVAENYKPSAVASKKYVVGGATGLVEYVSTFTDMKLNTKEKTMTWESSLEANSFESANSKRGVQFGAGKGKFTITGTGHTSNVKKISVIISTNAASGNTISATVGGVAIGKQISLNKANNYEIVFESTTELSGDIVFSVNDASKSVYIKSITVNPSN